MGGRFVRWRSGLSVAWFRRLVNLYAPFVGAGIRLASISEDSRHARVEMKLRWYNANYVGTHFGGSIYAMTDPFYMLMYMRNLGPGYVMWDKAARIDFLKPGRGRLTAEFHLSDEDLAHVREATASGEKYVFDKDVLVHDAEGTLIAKVVKTLYVRRKAG